jgi:hypothetical protein
VASLSKHQVCYFKFTEIKWNFCIIQLLYIKNSHEVYGFLLCLLTSDCKIITLNEKILFVLECGAMYMIEKSNLEVKSCKISCSEVKKLQGDIFKTKLI